MEYSITGMYLHDTVHSRPVLDFHFIPFDPNVVHRIVHMYTAVLGAQPHGWLALEIDRVRGVHAVRNAVVARFFFVVFFARRTAGQRETGSVWA